MGVPVPRFVTLVFLLGGLLGGVAGFLLASLFPLTPTLGSHFIVKGFAIALAGGLGNVAGALAASLVLGLGEALVAGLGFAAWTDVTAFLLMILILLVRPQGFFKGVEAPH
jgi:branched-chain amino acid transport system permease protein